MVKPKDWEIKLAEKERRRKEKKSLLTKGLNDVSFRPRKGRRRKNEKGKHSVEAVSNGQEKNVKGKAKIAAFGALNAIAGKSDSDSDDEKIDKSPVVPSKPKGSGLLSMLPTPKSGKSTVGLGGANSKSTGIMLPPSMRNKNVASNKVSLLFAIEIFTTQILKVHEDEVLNFFSLPRSCVKFIHCHALDVLHRKKDWSSKSQKSTSRSVMK
ncbi:hypothetical protein TELCIR_19518 [Teladorsagia circumcincta]|uniref:Uncharacterized protein n=1 Tax=Teladorsagia circumcincta TaxID=45464 RepID=A0A2G9TNH3_TELCI|nr:hypothetical protein TELCIR_19518 [Teladorsagia circumcincta]